MYPIQVAEFVLGTLCQRPSGLCLYCKHACKTGFRFDKSPIVFTVIMYASPFLVQDNRSSGLFAVWFFVWNAETVASCNLVYLAITTNSPYVAPSQPFLNVRASVTVKCHRRLSFQPTHEDCMKQTQSLRLALHEMPMYEARLALYVVLLLLTSSIFLKRG